MEEYTDALVKEIYKKAYGFKDRTVSSIFFGGGTPSLLKTELTEKIMNKLYGAFKIDSGAEITSEANPGTVCLESLKAYRDCGFNRISFGLQSADDRELQRLGRIHTYKDFLDSYDLAGKAGFDNINIDIMSALPGQTLDSYKETLRKVAELDPAHISSYSLIIEEGTPFYDRYKNGEGLPSEDEEREMYALTKSFLEDRGYKRYEISNYAKEGYECRHNCLYWERGEYLGLGLNAASFTDGVRYKNEDDLKKYIKDGYLKRYEETVLGREEALEETMFLGLRMMKGVLETPEISRTYGPVIDKHERLGLIIRDKGRIRLTDRGIDVSNSLLSDYIL